MIDMNICCHAYFTPDCYPWTLIFSCQIYVFIATTLSCIVFVLEYEQEPQFSM